MIGVVVVEPSDEVGWLFTVVRVNVRVGIDSENVVKFVVSIVVSVDGA